MNEKPFRLDMRFNEAISRLAKTPKKPIKDKGIGKPNGEKLGLDYEKRGAKNEKNGATEKPRHSAGKADPAD